MRFAVDLHIHTALSPCCDNDMTPNNISNMAYIKGLDIIAVTDHNCIKNFPAVASCASALGILAIPGMELETREEVHVICLFPAWEEALAMQEIVFKALPDIPNREDIFGEQLIMDEEDEITGRVGRMLITAADIGVEEAVAQVTSMGGVVIPAHVDRESYSILSNLGSVPDDLPIHVLEISKRCDPPSLRKKYEDLGRYRFILSSDAHHLGDILERESFLEMEEKSIPCFFEALKSPF